MSGFQFNLSDLNARACAHKTSASSLVHNHDIDLLEKPQAPVQ